jgi:hypothetical protein
MSFITGAGKTAARTEAMAAQKPKEKIKQQALLGFIGLVS